MLPWETLDRTTTPDGSAMTLVRRGDEYAVRVNHQLLMSSRQHASEDSLAKTACERLQTAKTPSLLIGGLGLGFTLRAALDLLPFQAKVTVAELVPALVGWNRGELGAFAGHPLQDHRVEVFEGDVQRLLDKKKKTFDAIALDVDNGPAAMTTETNRSLYDYSGLAKVRGALKDGGRLVVWSASDDKRFVRRLEDCGFKVRIERPLVRGAGSARHVLFVAEDT